MHRPVQTIQAAQQTVWQNLSDASAARPAAAEAVGGLCSVACSDRLCLISQDDTELDDQVRLLSGPEGSIRVVQMQPNQLSLKLWEPLCADNPNPGGPPLLLMPPEYDWLDPENGPRELAEIMYIGQRVSMSLVALQWATLP